MLYQVTTNYFCCGIITDDNDLIIDVAPIMYWSIGKRFEDIRWWISSKNGTVRLCQEN